MKSFKINLQIKDQYLTKEKVDMLMVLENMMGMVLSKVILFM